MKLLFEQYGYSKGALQPLLDAHYFSELQGGVAQIPYVGYFLSHKIPDTVFILPKVFIIEGKAFGKYAPEDIVDFETLADEDKRTVFALSVWIYRAIKLYCQRKSRQSDATEVMQNVVSHTGQSSETMIDIVLSLLKFHKDHRNLFTYITRIKHTGQSKIHWQKTISKTQAIVQHGRPIYLNPQTRQREVDYDEELIVLFFSVLNYLNAEYHFDIHPVFGYELIKPSKIRDMIDSGKGMRLLRQNRRKYFTDEMVQLWNLLFTFFEQSQHVRSKTKSDEQAMLVRDFNLVFEDMIDSLIGESNLPRGLKEQKDGKIIDHIYRDHSLIDIDDDIYFIGDSKYYKEGNEISKNSIYKQYTYAKNVILYNVGVFDGIRQTEDKSVHYLDKNTEGYNITPNFFIRGHIEKDRLSDYSNSGLREEKDKVHISYHFENRLFDRDTLILQTYNINFLFVLAAYVQGAGEHTKEIRRVFRENVKDVLQRHYQFYAIKPRIQGEAEGYLKEHFQDVLGKVYAPYDTAQTNCLSLALDNAAKYDEGNERLRSELEQHFFIHEIANGNIDGNPETLFGEDEQTKTYAYGTEQANSKVLIVVDIQNSNWEHFDTMDCIYIGMETANKAFEYYHEFADADYILLTHRDKERTFLFKTHGKPSMQNEKPQNGLGRSFKKPSENEQLMWPDVLYMVFRLTKEDIVSDIPISLKRMNDTAVFGDKGRDWYSPRICKLKDVIDNG